MPDASNNAESERRRRNNNGDELRPFAMANVATAESDKTIKRRPIEIGHLTVHRTAVNTARSSKTLICSGPRHRAETIVDHFFPDRSGGIKPPRSAKDR